MNDNIRTEVFEAPITNKDWLTSDSTRFPYMKPMLLSWFSELISAKTYIEIGLYKMHTFEYMNSKLDDDVKMIGYDLFEPPSEEELGCIDPTISYDNGMKLIQNWNREVELVKGDTNITLQGDFQVDSPTLVYLDGGHSYGTAKSDFWNLYNGLDSGLIIVDDWINPDVLERGFIDKYGYHYDYTKTSWFRFMDTTWKLAKELHSDSRINISYISDIFNEDQDNEIEFLGIIVI